MRFVQLSPLAIKVYGSPKYAQFCVPVGFHGSVNTEYMGNWQLYTENIKLKKQVQSTTVLLKM